eukprot:403350276
MAVLGLAQVSSELSQGQDCQQNDHTITSIPYWNAKDTLPCMYSGTLQSSIKEGQDHNLFYWLIKNTQLENPNLILWINGGPGSSSMFGLFLENGPIQVLRTNNPTGDDYITQLNKDGSWADIADVLYLDQPVGVGFSFGNSILDRMKDGASELIQFLENFMIKYPEYQANGRKFYISGESYSGKYIPLFATYINQYNKGPQQTKINLQGLFIGNPYLAPLINSVNTYHLGQALNLVDEQNLDQVAALRKRCEEYISTKWSEAPPVCDSPVNYINDVAGGVFKFDSRQFYSEWSPVEQVLYDFLSNSIRKQELYKAIHIEKSTKVPIYEPSSEKVSDAYQYEVLDDYTNIMDEVIQSNIPVLVFAGEWDQGCGPAMHDIWINNLQQLKTAELNYQKNSRQIYYIKDSNNNLVVGGYYRFDQDKKFYFLTVPKSGHFVPTKQLAITKQFITDFMSQNKLLCHHDDPTKCNTAPIKCSYMNKCSGNGQCDDLVQGTCKCSEGFEGADCSAKIIQLKDGFYQVYQTNGTQWMYFQAKYTHTTPDQYLQLTLSSQFPMDVYVRRDILDVYQNLDEFNYDLAFKKQNYLKLRNDEFQQIDEQFRVLIKINGINNYMNQYNLNKLSVQLQVKQYQ